MDHNSRKAVEFGFRVAAFVPQAEWRQLENLMGTVDCYLRARADLANGEVSMEDLERAQARMMHAGQAIGLLVEVDQSAHCINVSRNGFRCAVPVTWPQVLGSERGSWKPMQFHRPGAEVPA